MQRPTLQDVAKLAGVSHMTVSRVVRGTLTVSPSTREKVNRAIAESGYKPDPVLSSLAAYRCKGSGHGNLLAFLDRDGTEYSSKVLDGVMREGSLLGYRAERFSLPRNPSHQKKLTRSLFHRGVRGLLFGPSDSPWQFEDWDWDEFAMVSLGALSHEPPMHAVAMDYFDGAAQGCRMLQRSGCQRPALIIEPALEDRTGGRWLGGYCSQLAPAKKPLVYQGPWRDTLALKKWIAREHIDGALTIHQDVCNTLKPVGLHIVFLNGDANNKTAPYYSLKPEHIGAEGVRLLHHLLLRREYGLTSAPKMVALRGKWESPQV
jgi:DNA-binding LacI/PurR family transcriptional regulator